MKRLVVMRHAKAEPFASGDHDRPLSQRGRDDAGEAGRWLADQDFDPDRALISDATRTAQTWAAVSQAAGWQTQADFDRALYTGDADSALDLIHLVDPAAVSAIVIGHNPTMASLVALLDDGSGVLDLDFPTSALTLFTYAGEWVDLGYGGCRLVASHVGRSG